MIRNCGNTITAVVIFLAVLILMGASSGSDYYYVYRQWHMDHVKAGCRLTQSYEQAPESDARADASPNLPEVEVEDVLGGIQLQIIMRNRDLSIGDIHFEPRELAVFLYSDGPAMDDPIDWLVQGLWLSNTEFQFAGGQGLRRNFIARGNDAVRLVEKLDRDEDLTAARAE